MVPDRVRQRGPQQLRHLLGGHLSPDRRPDRGHDQQPPDEAALQAFADRVELAFQTTSIDHATALGESTDDALARLRAALTATQEALTATADGLVDRLETAANVHGQEARDLSGSLHADVEAARQHLRDAVADAEAAIADAIGQAAQAAVASLRGDVAEAARRAIPDAAAAAAVGVGEQADELAASLRTAVAQSQQRMADAVESAVGRLERVADAVDRGGADASARITATADGHAELLRGAVTDVVVRMQQLAEATADVDTRLSASVGQVERAATTAADRLEKLGDAAMARVVADAGELMARVQDATTTAEGRIAAVAEQTGTQIALHVDAAVTRMDAEGRSSATVLSEAVRDAVAEVAQRAAAVGDAAARDAAAHTARLADAAEDLTRTVAAVTSEMGTRADTVATAADQVADASTRASAAAADLEVVAGRVDTSASAAVTRSAEVTDTMAQRFGDMMDAAVQTSRDATTGNIETLTTTVAWAGRTVQGLIERLIDDLTSTADTATQRVDAAGEAARVQLVAVVEELESRLVQEVSRALGPLRVETGRVAEQQAGLAETAAAIEALMGQREAEAARRDEAVERIEQAVVLAAEMVSAGTVQLQEEQDTALVSAREVADQLADGGMRAAALMAQLTSVTERLEAATAAADASRQSLEQVVQRAEELAADAAARRRRAPVVPPPGA